MKEFIEFIIACIKWVTGLFACFVIFILYLENKEFFKALFQYIGFGIGIYFMYKIISEAEKKINKNFSNLNTEIRALEGRIRDMKYQIDQQEKWLEIISKKRQETDYAEMYKRLKEDVHWP